ncbi:hypothetical protein AAHE18_09G075600 [Arachis hypogaea]
MYRFEDIDSGSSLKLALWPRVLFLLHCCMGREKYLNSFSVESYWFGGWLGKNSMTGKNLRLMEDLHVHMLASRESSSGRDTIRLEYLTLLLKQLTEPLRSLPKAEAVEKVVEFI